MDKLAIVVPCYNEEEVLKIASEALRGVLDDLIGKGKIAKDSFILFVNDSGKFIIYNPCALYPSAIISSCLEKSSSFSRSSFW